MFFLTSKILSFLASPIVWIFLVLMAAFIKKDSRTRVKLFAIATGMFYFFSNEFLFDVTFGHWEPRYVTENRIAPGKVYEAGIVLGGMTWYDEETARPQFLRSADRLYQAVWLLKQRKIKKIIFSGGSGSLSTPHIKEADHIKKWLAQIGIADSLVIIDNRSNNTHENAVCTKKILDSLHLGTKPKLLITSASHMRRALACFRKQSVFNLTVFPTDYYSSEFRIELDHCLVPNTETFHAYTVVMHEMLGYLVYKIMGYC